MSDSRAGDNRNVEAHLSCRAEDCETTRLALEAYLQQQPPSDTREPLLSDDDAARMAAVARYGTDAEISSGIDGTIIRTYRCGYADGMQAQRTRDVQELAERVEYAMQQGAVTTIVARDYILGIGRFAGESQGEGSRER